METRDRFRIRDTSGPGPRDPPPPWRAATRPQAVADRRHRRCRGAGAGGWVVSGWMRRRPLVRRLAPAHRRGHARRPGPRHLRRRPGDRRQQPDAVRHRRRHGHAQGGRRRRGQEGPGAGRDRQPRTAQQARAGRVHAGQPRGRGQPRRSSTRRSRAPPRARRWTRRRSNAPPPQRDLERYQRAFEGGAVSQNDYAKAQDDLKKAEIGLAAARKDSDLQGQGAGLDTRNKRLLADRQRAVVVELQRQVDALTAARAVRRPGRPGADPAGHQRRRQRAGAGRGRPERVRSRDQGAGELRPRPRHRHAGADHQQRQAQYAGEGLGGVAGSGQRRGHRTPALRRRQAAARPAPEPAPVARASCWIPAATC